MKQLFHSHLLRAVLFLLCTTSLGAAQAQCPVNPVALPTLNPNTVCTNWPSHTYDLGAVVASNPNGPVSAFWYANSADVGDPSKRLVNLVVGPGEYWATYNTAAPSGICESAPARMLLKDTPDPINGGAQISFYDCSDNGTYANAAALLTAIENRVKQDPNFVILSSNAQLVWRNANCSQFVDPIAAFNNDPDFAAVFAGDRNRNADITLYVQLDVEGCGSSCTPVYVQLKKKPDIEIRSIYAAVERVCRGEEVFLNTLVRDANCVADFWEVYDRNPSDPGAILIASAPKGVSIPVVNPDGACRPSILATPQGWNQTITQTLTFWIRAIETANAVQCADLISLSFTAQEACPANVVVCSDPVTNNWTGAGLGDVCENPTRYHRLNNQDFQPGNANGRIFNIGNTTVTYRIGEGAHATSCAFTVTVRKTPRAYYNQTAISICNGASLNLASYARDYNSAAKRYNFYEGDANGEGLVFLGTVTATNGNVNFGQNRMVLPSGNNSTPSIHYYYLIATNTFSNGPSCSSGLSGALVVTVNPVPSLSGVLLNPSGQICPGNAVSVNFSSSLPGSSFSWSNSNAGIGLAANGNGNINFVAAAPGSSILSAYAIKANCTSAPVQTPLTVSACSQSRMFSTGDDPFGGAGAPQLYPNPSNGQLFLRLPENDAPALYATRLEFFDSAGRRVWSESFELAGGAERRLDLSRLPAGVYGWTLRIGDAGYNGRVVKQ